MTEIVTIMPRRPVSCRAILLLAGAAFAAIVLASADTDANANISHDQARAFVAEAGGDTDVREIYPRIEDRAMIVLVGTGCGENKETLFFEEEDQFPIWGCEKIEAMDLNPPLVIVETPTDHPGEMDS